MRICLLPEFWAVEQKRLFFRRTRAAECGIAMLEAPEAANDVQVLDGVVKVELVEVLRYSCQ